MDIWQPFELRVTRAMIKMSMGVDDEQWKLRQAISRQQPQYRLG